MEIKQAVNSLKAALDEEYPGEFLDPEALRTVLDRLAELEGMQQRARHAIDMSTHASVERAALYILGPVPTPKD